MLAKKFLTVSIKPLKKTSFQTFANTKKTERGIERKRENTYSSQANETFTPPDQQLIENFTLFFYLKHEKVKLNI